MSETETETATTSNDSSSSSGRGNPAIPLTEVDCVNSTGPNTSGNLWATVEDSSGNTGTIPNVKPESLEGIPNCDEGNSSSSLPSSLDTTGDITADDSMMML